jgi:hypothetical protein
VLSLNSSQRISFSSMSELISLMRLISVAAFQTEGRASKAALSVPFFLCQAAPFLFPMSFKFALLFKAEFLFWGRWFSAGRFFGGGVSFFVSSGKAISVFCHSRYWV